MWNSSSCTHTPTYTWTRWGIPPCTHPPWVPCAHHLHYMEQHNGWKIAQGVWCFTRTVVWAGTNEWLHLQSFKSSSQGCCTNTKYLVQHRFEAGGGQLTLLWLVSSHRMDIHCTHYILTDIHIIECMPTTQTCDFTHCLTHASRTHGDSDYAPYASRATHHASHAHGEVHLAMVTRSELLQEEAQALVRISLMTTEWQSNKEGCLQSTGAG